MHKLASIHFLPIPLLLAPLLPSASLRVYAEGIHGATLLSIL
jgi:hypothetical protein